MALLLLPAAVQSQSPAPIQTVRFTVFAPNPPADVACVLRPGAAPQKLKFFPSARSPRYEYRGTLPLRFVDPETRAIVAEASIPPNLAQPLLLFTPMEPGRPATDKLRYRIAVMDDSAARHAPGGLSIVNLSGLALGGAVNNQAVTLQPGLNPTLAIGRAATVRFTTVFKQRKYQSYAGTVKLAANQRALLLLFPPFYQGSLEVQSRLLIDQPSAAPAPRK